MVFQDVINASSENYLYEDFVEDWDCEPPVKEMESWEIEQLEEQHREFYNLSPSEFVSNTIQVPNPTTRKLENFDFSERPYLRKIYDSSSRRKLLLAARQVEKSTFLGNYLLTMCCLIPHFRALYVSPSSTQTKEFSKTRLKEPIETSPALRSWFPPDLTDNVYEKKAINRSEIKLRYAFLNADRVRGLSADLIDIDEFQDLLLDNIPVIEEAASHSPFKFFTYSGTPKSLDNPIQYYWDRYSTQNEWAVPCERHGLPKQPGSWHWNILGEANIGHESLVCDKCKYAITPRHPKAQWVRTGDPDPKFEHFDGFRIPQLMVPWIEWKDILGKYHSYSRAQFHNEVLGQSFDSGQRPLTKEDLMRNCSPKLSMSEAGVKDIIRRLAGGKIYAGIDWGQDSSNSYTVICLGAYIDGAFTIFYIHRFYGSESEPRAQLDKIMRLIDAMGVHVIGADYGGGFWPNGELMKRYGTQRIRRYQYTNPSVFLTYENKLGRYLVHKAEVMSAIFNAIKRGTVFRFPNWQEFQAPFGADFLSIWSEYNERTRMTEYKKSPNTTDDSFHAVLMCFLASMNENPREDVFVPGASVDRSLLNS